MSLRPDFEERLQKTMAEINSGERPAKDIREVTETFLNITEKLNMATALLTGDIASVADLQQEETDDYDKYFSKTSPSPAITPTVHVPSTCPVTEDLEQRRKVCWDMVDVFLRSQDARGLHNMSVEILALDKAITEINKLKR